MKRTPKKKKNKNHYFTKVHEDAIVRYCKSTDNKERNELYKVYIGPVFDEMVDKIVYTYKFNNLPNIDPLRDECKTWLTTILDKYDPSKGSRAFSYFSVITKNWFIHKVKRQQKMYEETGDYDAKNAFSNKNTEKTNVENKNEEEVARYKMRYIDYNVEQAIRKFQIDLKEFAELLEENNILTNEAYLNYKHTL